MTEIAYLRNINSQRAEYEIIFDFGRYKTLDMIKQVESNVNISKNSKTK